jgi:nicotinamide-nucleotide amidase
LLGRVCYGTDDTDLAAVLLDQLRAAGRTLAIAESCTGGLLGARLTAIPGSSDVFLGGVTAYSNDVKVHSLGVPAALLEEHGAVSEAVALAMAEGAQRTMRVDTAIAVTGVAGPAGGTSEKPVGTVCLAAAAPGSKRADLRRYPGLREEVRSRSAQAALDLLRCLLLG